MPYTNDDAVLARLVNQSLVDGGRGLAPQTIKGGFKVLPVTGFQIISKTQTADHIEITFGFLEVISQDVDHYEIYVSGINGSFSQLNLASPAILNQSPGTVKYNITPYTQNLLFKIVTVLRNGYKSSFELSPSCSINVQNIDKIQNLLAPGTSDTYNNSAAPIAITNTLVIPSNTLQRGNIIRIYMASEMQLIPASIGMVECFATQNGAGIDVGAFPHYRLQDGSAVVGNRTYNMVINWNYNLVTGAAFGTCIGLTNPQNILHPYLHESSNTTLTFGQGANLVFNFQVTFIAASVNNSLLVRQVWAEVNNSI